MGQARPVGQETAKPARRPRLTSRSREAVGQALKEHYATLLEEPLPERIRELLAALEKGGGEGPGKA